MWSIQLFPDGGEPVGVHGGDVRGGGGGNVRGGGGGNVLRVRLDGG